MRLLRHIAFSNVKTSCDSVHTGPPSISTIDNTMLIGIIQIMNDMLVWLLIGLFFGVWMYIDAKARKLERPSNWIWIGLIFGIFGLLTYWYWHVYPKPKAKKK